MRAYIAILGRSVWALLNTYYAVIRDEGYRPDRIFVFAEEIYQEDLRVAEKGLRIISQGFGLQPIIGHKIVEEAGFLEAGRRMSSLVKKVKTSGGEVAIDITSGRKALVAGTLLSLAKVQVDHVYYLAITSLEDACKPYMMIPLQIQSLKDFVSEVKT